MCEIVERVAGHHAMVAPAGALVFGDRRNPRCKQILGARRNMKIVGFVGRRSSAQQTWIEIFNRRERDAGDIGHQVQIDGIAGSHCIRKNGGVRHDTFKTVLLRVFRHDGDGEDDGNIVLGLLRQVVAPVKLPEVHIASSLHSALHVSRAPVVGGHGEVPVAQLVVGFLDIAGIGTRGFFRIEALVIPARLCQPVCSIRHELPHAARA